MINSRIKSILLLVLAVGVNLIACSVELPEALQINQDGTIKISDAKIVTCLVAPPWKSPEKSQWTISGNQQGKTLQNDLIIKGVKGTITEKLIPLGPDEFRFEAEFVAEEPADIKRAYVSMFFTADTKPGALLVNDKEIGLGGTYQNLVVSECRSKVVEVRIGNGYRLAITGDTNLRVQDNRRLSENNYELRFHFVPQEGKLSKTALQLTFKLTKVTSNPIDMAMVANRGFSDNDGTGWTGQGRLQDLRVLRPGDLSLANLQFKIIDEVKNGGKGALVLGGKRKSQFQHGAELKFSTPITGGALNLLHADAWSPEEGLVMGTITVIYADNTSEEIPVREGTDCSNWWFPRPGALNNAALAWQDMNQTSTVGLYVSSFPLRDKPVAALKFNVAADDSVWMIAAMNVSSQPVHFSVEGDVNKPLVITKNALWHELDYQSNNKATIKDSPLDFSFLLKDAAPAGKFGFVIARPDGSLAFEKAPERKIRFMGTNLCGNACFPDRKTAEYIVDELARNGYNSVRLHHYDSEIIKKDTADSLTFDPVQLDKFEYFFALLKQRGFYITTDFYTTRDLRPGDGINSDTKCLKPLIHFDPAAMENWKSFTRKLMTHVNPYTGLAMKDDPALFCVNLVNEDPLWSFWKWSPLVEKHYTAAFEQWKVVRADGKGKVDQSNPEFRRFLNETQQASIERQMDFVKNELKLKTLVTSLNWGTFPDLALLRNNFPLVDVHGYWDHPYGAPKGYSNASTQNQVSALKMMGHLPRILMPTRLFGKPFIVTEFNYCHPNQYRAEGGPLMGAYAAFQDWSGIYRFCWNNNTPPERLHIIGRFDTYNEPLLQFSDRIVAALFLRGDIAPAKAAYAREITPDVFKHPDSYGNFSMLGLCAQIGSVVAGSQVPAGVTVLNEANSEKPSALKDKTIAALWEDAADRRYVTTPDRQIALNSMEKTLVVTSPLTEAVTLEKGMLKAGVMTVKNADSFQTVAAISLDGLPLRTSRSILLLHLTDLIANGQQFNNFSRTIRIGWGEPKMLIRRGTAMVELQGEPCRVEALSVIGKPLGIVAIENRTGAFSFPINTTAFPGGVMAYHLTR